MINTPKVLPDSTSIAALVALCRARAKTRADLGGYASFAYDPPPQDLETVIILLDDRNLYLGAMLSEAQNSNVQHKHQRVWGFYEDAVPKYFQEPNQTPNELCSLVTAEEVNGLVQQLEDARKENKSLRKELELVAQMLAALLPEAVKAIKALVPNDETFDEATKEVESYDSGT